MFQQMLKLSCQVAVSTLRVRANVSLSTSYSCWLCPVLGSEFCLLNLAGSRSLGGFLLVKHSAGLSEAVRGRSAWVCAAPRPGKGPGPWGRRAARSEPSVLCSQVVLLGIDILSALVSRLQDRFKAQIGTGKGSVGRGGGCRCRSGGIPSGLAQRAATLPRRAPGRLLVALGSAEGWEGSSLRQAGAEQRGCATAVVSV